jgi:hypothetical protein
MVAISDTEAGNSFLFGELDNADSWPSKTATDLFSENLIAIVERGFQGVRLRWSQRANGQILMAPAFNMATPEGRLGKCLQAIATKGRQLLTAEVIAILERVYREQNLPLPSSPDESGKEGSR